MVENLGHLMDDDERLVKLKVFKNYHDLTKRLKKTCYYGKSFSTTPSLPFSIIVVEFFNQATALNEDLKKLDLNYVSSVSKGAYITPCSIVMGMMYVEQLLQNHPDYLQKISPNQLFLVSMMVASKFINESEEVYLADFAEAGKQSVEDLTALEMDFLRKMDWKLGSNQEEVTRWLRDIEYRIVFKESSKRGWCTYTDLTVMLERLLASRAGDTCGELLAYLLAVLALLTAVYLTSLLTLVALMSPGAAMTQPAAVIVAPSQPPVSTPNLSLPLLTPSQPSFLSLPLPAVNTSSSSVLLLLLDWDSLLNNCLLQ